MRSSRTRKEITDAYGRYIQRISLRQLWQRLYLKIKIMNLNITPTDKISEELAAIDAFLNITMSEDVQEAVLRGNDLAVYIARTGKLHLNGKKKSEVFDTLRETASRAGATSKAINAIIDSLCKDEQYLVDWCDRLNRTATHQLEWCRTIISKAKAEMALAPQSYNNPKF